MLAAAQRERAGRASTCVVGVVETHGRAETEALLAGLERCRCSRVAYRGRSAARVRPRRRARAQAGADPGRRAGALQRAGLAPPQALAGRRGAARRRHRRLDDAERPAPREPERRGRPHHRRRACARRCPTACSTRPTRWCWSTCRPTTCCSACRRARSTCRSRPSARCAELLPQGQPDRAARAGAAPHRRARRRRRCWRYRRERRRSQPVWGTRERAAGLRRPARARRADWCAPPRAWPRSSTCRWHAVYVETPALAAPARRAARAHPAHAQAGRGPGRRRPPCSPATMLAPTLVALRARAQPARRIVLGRSAAGAAGALAAARCAERAGARSARRRRRRCRSAAARTTPARADAGSRRRRPRRARLARLCVARVAVCAAIDAAGDAAAAPCSSWPTS